MSEDAIVPQVRSVESMVERSRRQALGEGAKNPACHSCRTSMWIGLFMDGTGNNRDQDIPKRCHSNVAALYQAHEHAPNRGIHALYIEGLGTPFRFDAYFKTRKVASRAGVSTVTQEGYREEGNSTMGRGFASGLTARMEKAVFDFCSAIERTRARSRVTEINVAAFGFSRGATSVRIFMHWLLRLKLIKRQGSALFYDGIPLKVRFLGIFDTVESVGAPAANQMPKLMKTTIPTFVERTVHLVAAHELRYSFPLTATGPARNVHRVVYPGAHSDIGGGYAPWEQGRSNRLARIVAGYMLQEARKVKVPLLSFGEMQALKSWKKGEALYEGFGETEDAQKVLNAYMAEVRPSGSVQQHFEAHMRHYERWIDSGQAMADVRSKQRNPQFRSNQEIRKALGVMEHLLRFCAKTLSGQGITRVNTAAGVSPQVARFFSELMHDSYEHFSATGGTLMQDTKVANYYKRREINQPTG